jgi:hypothetical protein
MKVKSITPNTGYYIEMEDSDYYSYIRYSENNWMVQMGEFYESLYDDKELEESFQQYIKK